MVVSSELAKKSYPNLNQDGYEWTSEPDIECNCIAWAAGKSDENWQHTGGYYWPAERRTQAIEALVEVFTNEGFEPCDGSTLEEGFVKIALYARNRLWTHAARQLPSGSWTSKLGIDDDITHATPECFNCLRYGEVYCYMKRAIDKYSD